MLSPVFTCKRVLFHGDLIFNLDVCYFRNHMNSTAAKLGHIYCILESLARLSSQLVAALWILFFPTYIPAWIIALLKLPNDFLSLLSRLLLFSVFYSQWGGGHNYFPAYSILLLASTHTSKHCYQFQAFYQFPSVHSPWSAQLSQSLLSNKIKDSNASGLTGISIPKAINE